MPSKFRDVVQTLLFDASSFAPRARVLAVGFDLDRDDSLAPGKGKRAETYVDPFVEHIEQCERVTVRGHERTSSSDRIRIALEKAEKGRLNAQARGHDQNGIDRLKDASEDEHLADGDVDGKTSEHRTNRSHRTVDRRERRLLLQTKQCRVDRCHLGRFDERESSD